MLSYFPQQNWEPFAYKRLNQIIDAHKQADHTALSEKDYAVFDFDNTSAINDIEDNTMIYMLDHLAYKLTPEELHTILTSGPHHFDQVLFPSTPKITLRNLAADITKQYRFLYGAYIQKDPEDRPLLEEMHETEQFKDFSAKLRLYYNMANDKLLKTAGESWPTFWFAGYTKKEFIYLVQNILAAALKTPFENRLFKSSEQYPGTTGTVESSFETGLAFPDELIQLYQAFQDNGIVVYVVSASPVDVVQTAVLNYDYQVPAERIFGVCYSFDDDGKITSVIQSETHITKKEGKTQLIEEVIKPLHKGKDPLALFGDSTGDYHMMTELKDSKLNVLFNRYMDNETKLLVEQAVKDYGQDEAKYLVQGRDENSGVLIPSQKTIPLGQEDPVLTADEFQGTRSLSE